jgi:hypothetical protein
MRFGTIYFKYTKRIQSRMKRLSRFQNVRSLCVHVHTHVIDAQKNIIRYR